MIKRLPPNNVEAEKAVIGAMMLDSDAIMVCSEILTAGEFYQQQYGIIFDALVEMYRDGIGADLVTIQNKLREKEVTPELYSVEYLGGQQVELPDNWKDLGGAWLLPKPQETETVRFGGTIRQFWDGGRLHVVPEGATEVLAIPCDMEIAGYGTNHVNTLRLWDAKSPVPLDMSLFSRGEYLRAQEQHAMAETIAKVLYPEDNHPEGKSLRLKQQYFFVSATMQSIVRKHIEVYGTAENFHEKNVILLTTSPSLSVVLQLRRTSSP